MSDYMVSESTGPRAVRYRRVVMWIHWITAILVLMQI
jgi:cytochrome b561